MTFYFKVNKSTLKTAEEKVKTQHELVVNLKGKLSPVNEEFKKTKEQNETLQQSVASLTVN